MGRAFFFAGIRLIDEGLKWESDPSRGSEILNPGVRRKYAVLDPYSANFSRTLRVTCRQDLVSAVSDLSMADTLDAMMMQLEERLIQASTEASPVSRVPDDTRTANVSGSYVAGGPTPVTITGLGGGWTPTVGRLVLFRDAATGNGFVSTITAYSGGVLTALLDEDISGSWDVYDCVAVFSGCLFSRMEHGAIEVSQRSDEWRPSIVYEFRTTSAGSWATDHQITPT